MHVLSAGELALAAAIVSVGALIQGSVGFGVALVSAPLLVLIDPVFVPGPMILAALVLTLLIGWRERQSLVLRDLGWALIGRIPGTVAGAAALALIPRSRMAPFFGALVLLAVAISVSGLRPRLTPRNLVLAGALSGLMGTATSIGGPPLALLYQGEAGPNLRGALAANFVVGASISLAAIAAVGRFGRAELPAAAALVPGVIVGFLLSARTARWLDRGFTRPAVLALASLAGAIAIARALL